MAWWGGTQPFMLGPMTPSTIWPELYHPQPSFAAIVAAWLAMMRRSSLTLCTDVTMPILHPIGPLWLILENQLQLHQATVESLSASEVQIDLYWSTATAVTQPLIAFIHIVGTDGGSSDLIAQDDAPPANGRWSWWQPGLIIHDPHTLTLSEPAYA